MAYPGGNGGPIPNYDNYGNPVSPTVGGEGSAPSGLGLAMAPQAPPMQPGVLGVGGFSVPAGSQSVPPPPGGSDALVAQGIYPAPDGSGNLAGMPGATPTEATAAATAPVQSAWSLALQQRMANGGIGNPMDFANFVRNRGAAPTPDAAAPAPMMQAQPRPLVIGPTNTTPAQIIPQPAPQGPGGMPPVGQPNVPPMPQVSPPNVPVNVRPNVPNPGTIGFFPQGRGLVR